MRIQVEELAENAEKYVNLAKDNDIWISKNGRDIARITNAETPKMKAFATLEALRKKMPQGMDYEILRAERIIK